MIFLLYSLLLAKEYRLSNTYLIYTWEVNANDIISTKQIENKYADLPLKIIPREGSEEFVISFKNSITNYLIKSSDLQIQNIHPSDSKIIFTFKPFTLNDITWDIKEIVELQANQNYLNKFIQIKSSNQDIFIDYIDLNYLIINDKDLTSSWSIPKSENVINNLGQPIYINSLFLGCHFPLTQSIIESDQKLAKIRYFAGKKFSKLTHNKDGYYETWKTVIGVSRSNQISVVRKDFFNYIAKISVLSPFRKHYSNHITKKSADSFKDVEQGCSQYGLPPLDSYVALNKFSVTKYAKKIKSNFGIDLSQHTSNYDIDKIKKDFVSYIHKYKTNYLQISDQENLRNSDDLYRITDLWEHILSAYEEMIQAAKEEKIENFWISSPSFTNLSPFHLQWSNSIIAEVPEKDDCQIDQMLTLSDQYYWSLYEERQIQFPLKNLQTIEKVKLDKNVDDDSFRSFLFGSVMRGSSFNEIKGQNWYVNSEVISWAESNFNVLQHSQLFGGQPMKGEIYGYSAFEGNDGFISFRNPGNEVKKFSIKIDEKIGLREKSVTLYRSTVLHYRTTDQKEIENGIPVHYGDTIEVTLQPGEHRIYEFHREIDHKPPIVEVIKTISENEILVRFDKHVDLTNCEFKIEGLSIIEKKLLGDLRTVTLKTSTAMKNYTVYSISIEKVKNIYGDFLNTKGQFQFYANNEIVSIYGETKGDDNSILLTDVNTDSFTINLHVKDFKGLQNGVLLHSEDDQIIVELDHNRHIKFTVGSVSVVSKAKISDSSDYQFSFVRERNTMLKIYVNTQIDSSNYIQKVPKMVNLKKLKLSKNPVVYSSIRVDNYALPYNEIPYEISLKNEFIEQIFSIENRKVKTKAIINHRAGQGESFTPASGSEEWSFAIPSVQSKARKTVMPINQFNIERSTDPFKHVFNFGKIVDLKAFSYHSKTNVKDQQYRIYVGNTIDEVENNIKQSKHVLEGRLKYVSDIPINVNFSKEIKSQFIALISDESVDSSDFNFYDEVVPENSIVVKSSDCDFEFEYRRNSLNEETIFLFYRYLYNRVQFNITKRYELLPNRTYIEKQISIKCSNKKQKFYYIDLDSYQLSESDERNSWSHPNLEQDEYSCLSPFIINLGQPIYINSFFTGCLFPLTENSIEDHVSHLRYHTGKTFLQLLDDNPFILDDQDADAYYCWKTVFGAARSSRREIVRQDLFDFISTISVPTTFRMQYNSWYDWMLNIDESNILQSFKEIENGFSKFGVPPLDSYVVDDGWNNYNTDKYNVYNEDYSGETYNKDGFWEFNSKFPNGLTKPSDLTDRFASHFGVWLGPRGGYVTPSQFGKVIEDAKNGYFNAQANDVDVGSKRYIEKLDAFLSNWISEYKVNYLKLDGFAFNACSNESHDHMVGGPSGVYYYTDLWERYLDVFEHFREVAEVNEIRDFWISITSYVNPSPFHLQWANSVWIQVSDDIGYVKVSENDGYSDQMLNYRDGCYFNFYDRYQFQFPSKCLYNHDPIYGKANTPLQNSLSNDCFRTFLYFCAARGNAFTEMYYTYSMLDEGDKWYINSEVLKWTQNRFDVLQHSQRFGGDPRRGEVYGYSAWNEKSGTIAIRNPSNNETKYTLKIDHEIGVPENIGKTYRKTVISHKSETPFDNEGGEVNYNDQIVFNLKPKEVKVIDFIETKDNEPPRVEVCRALSNQRVLVRFNKRIVKKKENFEIDNLEIKNVSIKADKRTVIIRTSPMEKDKKYELELEDLSDQFGNKLNDEIEFIYKAHGLFSLNENENKRIQDKDVVLSDDEFNADSFSFQLNIHNRNDQDFVILEDDQNAFKVEIVNKKIKFTVGNLSVISRDEIPLNDCRITLVRERNKMIKIYINGELSNSAYNDDISNDIVSLHRITLKQAPISYNNVYAANYAFKYNEEANDSDNDDDNYIDEDDDLLDEPVEGEVETPSSTSEASTSTETDTITSIITSSSSSTGIETSTTTGTETSTSTSTSSSQSSPVISGDDETSTTDDNNNNNDGNNDDENDDFDLKLYLIIGCMVGGLAIVLAIILIVIIKKAKPSKKSQITYPLMSENL